MANNLTKYTVAEAMNLKLGQNGFDKIDQGSAETGHWCAIYNYDGSAVQIDVTSAVGDSLTNFALPAGDTIYGNFTAITVDTSSKSVIAYRG